MRVKDAARILDLEPYLKRKPRALSGGQRQRVAMGRAIVRNPSAFLMDEPLSNLDAKLRVQMRAEISELQRELGVTTLYVTHDQVEAMTMGDRVAVMRKGELQQVADPQTLYDDPVNLFVAGFIGSPAMNLLEATVGRDNGSLYVQAGSERITLDNETLAQHPAIQAYVGRDVVLGIRPEDLEDREPCREDRAGRDAARNGDPPRGARLRGHGALLRRRPSGGHPGRDGARRGRRRRPRAGRQADEGKTVIVGRFGARSRVRTGRQIQVAVDTRQMHFFDPETGLGIYHDVPEPAAAPAPA